MKLRKTVLLEITKGKDEYVYTYGVFATKAFKKKYFKLVFKSKIPHFMWTEIMKMMINQGIYFEDLAKGEPKNIKIGSIEYLDLTDEDIRQYGTDISTWEKRLMDVIRKQELLEEKYNKKHGHPDLSGTGLWSDYDPHKNW